MPFSSMMAYLVFLKAAILFIPISNGWDLKPNAIDHSKSEHVQTSCRDYQNDQTYQNNQAYQNDQTYQIRIADTLGCYGRGRSLIKWWGGIFGWNKQEENHMSIKSSGFIHKLNNGHFNNWTYRKTDSEYSNHLNTGPV